MACVVVFIVEEHTHTEQAFTDNESPAYDLLYPGHIQTNFFQKALLSFGAAAVAVTSPWRGGRWLLST